MYHDLSLTVTNCSAKDAIGPHQRRRSLPARLSHSRSRNTPEDWDTPAAGQGRTSNDMGYAHVDTPVWPHAQCPELEEQQLQRQEEQDADQPGTPDQIKRGSLGEICHWLRRHTGCFG